MLLIDQLVRSKATCSFNFGKLHALHVVGFGKKIVEVLTTENLFPTCVSHIALVFLWVASIPSEAAQLLVWTVIVGIPVGCFTWKVISLRKGKTKKFFDNTYLTSLIKAYHTGRPGLRSGLDNTLLWQFHNGAFCCWRRCILRTCPNTQQTRSFEVFKKHLKRFLRNHWLLRDNCLSHYKCHYSFVYCLQALLYPVLERSCYVLLLMMSLPICIHPRKIRHQLQSDWSPRFPQLPPTRPDWTTKKKDLHNLYAHNKNVSTHLICFLTQHNLVLSYLFKTSKLN